MAYQPHQTNNNKDMTEKDRQERVEFITMLMHGLCMVYKMDSLGDRFMAKDVKMSAKNFLAIFQRRYKRELQHLFDVTSSGDTRGDAFLEAQEIVDAVASEIVDIAYENYPGLIDLIRAYKSGDVRKDG